MKKYISPLIGIMIFFIILAGLSYVYYQVLWVIAKISQLCLTLI